ncbi:TPA: HAD-IIB family hydrolase [Streptococcus pneumoniae]|nr:HAD-IIB family hydrolase [Streptococcus pneumoniae]
MDAKLRYKAKKIKIVFFDIDDTLRNSKTGFIPTTIPTVFKQLREKGILTGIASGRGIFGVVPEIRDLKPDFFVTLNGAYIEDKKGQVIYQHQIEKSDVEEYISWAKQEGIEYGLVGSHDAKLSTRTDMMSEAINPIYPDLDVDPDFHEKEDIYQMWTFEDKGDDLHLPDSLSDKLRMVRWHQHSSDIVPISGSKATGVEKVVEHLGLKPEKVMVFGDGLNDLELFDYAGPNTNGSQFFIVQNQHLPYSKKEITRGGWPEPIAEIYANQGGTPHLDRRHTVFGQLADEASYAVLDAIAAVETGAMDKPVEDVVIETIEIED